MLGLWREKEGWDWCCCCGVVVIAAGAVVDVFFAFAPPRMVEVSSLWREAAAEVSRLVGGAGGRVVDVAIAYLWTRYE